MKHGLLAEFSDGMFFKPVLLERTDLVVAQFAIKIIGVRILTADATFAIWSPLLFLLNVGSSGHGQAIINS